MSWFFIALIAPALWGITNYIDKFLISKYFKGSGTGAVLIFSALAGIILIPFIIIFFPSSLDISIRDALILVLNGILVILALLPYFYALKRAEASNVIPIYQSVPMFSYIMGFIFLNESLRLIQVVGMIIIIFGSIGISIDLLGGKFVFNKKPFFLMLLASIMYATSGVIFKFIAVKDGFATSLLWTYVGNVCLAIFLLIFIRSYRIQFLEVLKRNRTAVLSLNILNEILNMGAELAMRMAIIMVPLAMAISVNGFQPVFVLFYGVILSIFFPQIIKENIEKNNIIKKVFFIFVILSGAYLLTK